MEKTSIGWTRDETSIFHSLIPVLWDFRFSFRHPIHFQNDNNFTNPDLKGMWSKWWITINQQFGRCIGLSHWFKSSSSSLNEERKRIILSYHHCIQHIHCNNDDFTRQRGKHVNFFVLFFSVMFAVFNFVKWNQCLRSR